MRPSFVTGADLWLTRGLGKVAKAWTRGARMSQLKGILYANP